MGVDYKTYLEHYGVLGMHWGVRKDRKYYEGKMRKELKKNSDFRKEDAKSFEPYKKSGISTKKGKPIFTGKEVRDMAKEYDKWYTDNEKKIREKYEKKIAKAVRKNKINDQFGRINATTSIGQRLLYNNATRATAAKYVVDNNMPVSEALGKAKKEAWRNTAIFVGVIGALTLGDIAYQKYNAG